MRPLPTRIAAWLAAGGLLLTGCFPHPPAYLRDVGDLSYYLDQATAIEHPDVATATLDEVTQSRPPITLADPDFDSFWDLTLEEAVSIGLQNNKVIRGYGTPGLQSNRVAPGIDNLANGPAGAGTMYNVAVRESEPGFIGTPGQIASPGSVVANTQLDSNQGVEAALADFDAQFTTSLYWDRTDTPRNTPIDRTTPGSAAFFQEDAVNFQAQLAKRTATGTQLFVRNVTRYSDNNVLLAPLGFQALRSIYQTAMEMEIRQPLLRGRGTFINRMPVVISRIGTDQEIANLEAQLQNMVTNIEIRYWDLYCAYRNLDSAKSGLDSAIATYRIVQDKFKEETETIQREAQAREQYFFFRAAVERAWAELLDAESNLRFLLGIASTDGRLIRPIDEPIKAPVEFDYASLLDGALVQRPELRQERWEIKKRQLAVAYAKNALLPSVNAVAQYRWLGLGDQLVSYDGVVPPFSGEGSAAWNDLLDGNFQEFRLGVEAGWPVGFRREMANVENAQLKLARERARLEDMELDVTRELQHALRATKTNYQLAQTNFNRWASTSTEVESGTRVYEVQGGGEALFVLLDAQRRRAQAEIAYFEALCEYNKVLALLQRRTGTALEYCGVYLEEGPWADKAYCDARESARMRGASRHMNYGWSRPEVISRGAVEAGPLEFIDEGTTFSNEIQNGAALDYYNGPSEMPVEVGDSYESLEGEFDSSTLPQEAPQLAPPVATPPRDAVEILNDSTSRDRPRHPVAGGGKAEPPRLDGRATARIHWGDVKTASSQPVNAPSNETGSRAVIRQVRYETKQ